MLSKWEVGHYNRSFVSQINKMVETLEQRLLPTFDRIKEEADQIEADGNTAYQNSKEAQEWVDPQAASEAGFEAASEHYDMMLYIKQGLHNMFAVGLYHLFEQQLREFHGRVLRGIPLDYAPAVLTAWDKEIPYPVLSDAQKLGIKELELLANTVKHGDGKSATKLHQINPLLFQDEWEREIDDDPSVIVHKPGVFTPMFGKEIFVGLEDIHRYQVLICEVWNAYLAAFQSFKEKSG